MKSEYITLGPLLQLEGHLPDGTPKTMDFGSGKTRGLILAFVEQTKKLVLVYPRQTSKIPTDRCERLSDTYVPLHEGAEIDACFEDQPRVPKGRTKVDLIWDAVTYKKRTAEPNQPKIPPYRHPFDLEDHEKPTLLIDQAGEYYIGNQRWVTVIEGGIDDAGSRQNPRISDRGGRQNPSYRSIVDSWWAR